MSKVGTTTVVNPYPGYDTYISKKSKNVDAILKFYDYTLTPLPEQGMVVNEGPVGMNWNWVDKPYGKWKFTNDDYRKLRNSGGPAQKAKATEELWQASTYSNKWYPWWTYAENDHAGGAKTAEFSKAIGKMGGVRVAEDYDRVQAEPGGLWEKYSPELENVRKEYRAKLIMAKDDAQFEQTWTEFQSALEKRGHWSELRTEWNQTYQEMEKK